MRKLLIALLLMLPVSAWAQEEKPRAHVDVFAGVDFQYRDIHWNKLMEMLINVTPGVKLHLGKQWQINGQMIIPVYNDYGPFYSKVRLGMASVSKELQLGTNHLKLSGGFFSRDRYGLDAKWMLPVTGWLAFDAQLGLTGSWSLQAGEISAPTRVTGWAGARVWLDRWATEGRIRAGRFVYSDYGALAEGYRHFKHVSVGAYGQWSSVGKWGAGFKIIVMLPPYRQKMRMVNFRPASYFLLSHNVMADTSSMKMYETDPEENDREGWFSLASWGPYSLSR